MNCVREQTPDLITLDITMPEQSGIRFYRNLKEDPQFISVPVVIVTAVTGYGGDSATFEKFLKSRRQVPPPDAFVSKPIDQKTFLDVVRDLINRE
jgi:CheY-like chemotaxis protein